MGAKWENENYYDKLGYIKEKSISYWLYIVSKLKKK